MDNALSKELLCYGYFVKDTELIENDNYKRVRIIRYNGECYRHTMSNGDVIEIVKVSRQ